MFVSKFMFILITKNSRYSNVNIFLGTTYLVFLPSCLSLPLHTQTNFIINFLWNTELKKTPWAK